ncbi:Symplectin/biotinidase-like protein 1 [Balamuthia mandrillaris]
MANKANERRPPLCFAACALGLLLLLLLCGNCRAGGLEETAERSYVAAVVEYVPSTEYPTRQLSREEARQVMLANLQQYGQLMEQATTQHQAQIIVFPEYGLTGPVMPNASWAEPYAEPIPEVEASRPIIPCQHSDPAVNPVLHRASCLAQRYKLVTVLNMADRQQQDGEPTPRLYNTLVALSHEGELLAKYHKTNLFFEPQWQPGDGEPVYFDTWFGVRFGMLICFDLMFAKPQAALLRTNAITDIVFSSWWVNYPPLITATESQQGWSRLNGVNLLASNTGLFARNSGSGIYSGGEALSTFYDPSSPSAASSTLLVANVTSPPSTTRSRSSPSSSLTPSSSSYLSVPLSTSLASNTDKTNNVEWNYQSFKAASGKTYELNVEANGLLCTAKLSVAATSSSSSSSPPETFSLVAFNGHYNGLFPAQICALMRCSTPTPSLASYCSDAETQSSSTMFSSFAIRSELKQTGKLAGEVRTLALVAGNASQLLPPAAYQVTANSIASSLAHENSPINLLTLVLFGDVWQ